jgi:hypothetical protein
MASVLQQDAARWDIIPRSVYYCSYGVRGTLQHACHFSTALTKPYAVHYSAMCWASIVDDCGA